ncbi:TonB-dependent siderophore receptor [Oleiharenicola lentus]|uniref:TonB-dependent siderophore receptor n=1 Tax=Oleiharenicola lentus TaxID=2508720 RepID=UPI003F680C6B
MALAQTTTSPAANRSTATAVAPLTNDVVVLDPFTVKADESGYRASNSVVATGFNRDIEHTPLTINVLTEDFIRDAGLNSYAEVSQFMPNTYVVPDPVLLGSTGNSRGQGTGYYTQDGVRYYTEPIVRSGARVEVIKGPATLFFGRAQPGGIFNFGTRPPSPVRQQSLTVSYGNYDKKSVDIGSQGAIDKNGRLTYRLDGSLQESGSFIDHAYDNLQFIRGAVSYKAFDTLRINARYENTQRQQSGNSIASSVIAEQYYLDYANPRPEHYTWARTQTGLGGLTDAQLKPILQAQWKENLNNWIAQTRLAFINDPNNKDGVYPTWATGISSELTPRGWHYNPMQLGTYAKKDIQTWGGDALWTPSQHVALKFAYTKYDLLRPRNNIQLTEVLADGTMRAASMAVREDQNDSTTMSLSALFDYDIGPTHHTTNIGGQYFKDYYRQLVGTYYGLNATPGVVRDPRTSTATIPTSGYVFATDGYIDVSKFISAYPRQTTPPAWAQNYENAYYASHIIELFDRKVGILMGGRVQEYEVRSIPFKNTADLTDINTLGVTWNISPNLVFFASRSKSFDPNINIFLITGAGATQAEKNDNIHPPVTGVGYDVGLKFGLLNRKLIGQFSLFETSRLNDAAFRFTDLERTNSDPRNNDADTNNNVTWQVPGGERLSRGAELELTWQPNKHYSALFTAGWLPVAKVVENEAIPFITTVDGRRIRDPNQGNYVGQRSPNSPKNTLSIWNHYKFPGTKWGAGLGGNYVSDVEIPNLSSYKITVPSYINVRAGVDYTTKITKGELRLSLTINNLLNEKYYISFYRGEPFAATFRAAYTF